METVKLQLSQNMSKNADSSGKYLNKNFGTSEHWCCWPALSNLLANSLRLIEQHFDLSILKLQLMLSFWHCIKLLVSIRLFFWQTGHTTAVASSNNTSWSCFSFRLSSFMMSSISLSVKFEYLSVMTSACICR